MYRLTGKKNGTYGVFDTSDNTITYLTFNDLIKVYSHTDIEGMAKMLMGYKARMTLLGVDIIIFEKTDIKEIAREKVKAMKPQPYKVFNFSDITNMSEMFTHCKATELDLSNFDTSKVTNMNDMFYSCNATKLDLSDFDTSQVKDMSFMFDSCKATKLDLSSFNTSKVTDMCFMFDSCKATKLDLSNFNTSEVTDMEDMFCYCKATELDLSNFNTSKVVNMQGMFLGCNIDKIALPKDIRTKQRIELELNK